MDLQSNYDVDAERDNGESTNTFVWRAYTVGSKDEDEDDCDEFQERRRPRARITNSSNLRTYIVLQTLNPRLKNCGASGLHPTTQQGFLLLINSHQGFC